MNIIQGEGRKKERIRGGLGGGWLIILLLMNKGFSLLGCIWQMYLDFSSSNSHHKDMSLLQNRWWQSKNQWWQLKVGT